MSLKLEKIAAEREKARRKRDEWEERRKEWDRKYHEQENSEICEMVHAQSLTPEQLAVIIQLAQAAVPNPVNLKLDEAALRFQTDSGKNMKRIKKELPRFE